MADQREALLAAILGLQGQRQPPPAGPLINPGPRPTTGPLINPGPRPPAAPPPPRPTWGGGTQGRSPTGGGGTQWGGGGGTPTPTQGPGGPQFTNLQGYGDNPVKAGKSNTGYYNPNGPDIELPYDPAKMVSWLFGGLPGVADASTGGQPAPGDLESFILHGASTGTGKGKGGGGGGLGNRAPAPGGGTGGGGGGGRTFAGFDVLGRPIMVGGG